MSRTLPEWIGATDDTMPPPRVRLRIAERQGDQCALCTRAFSPKLPIQIDHKVPLILGGLNRESNLQAVCPYCHKAKSASEMKVKSKIAKARQDRLGIKSKPKGRPMPGTKASGWKKRMDGSVERR